MIGSHCYTCNYKDALENIDNVDSRSRVETIYGLEIDKD